MGGGGCGRANASGRRVTLGHVRVMAPEADTRADMIPATGLTGDAAALPDCPAIQRPPTRAPRHTWADEDVEGAMYRGFRGCIDLFSNYIN